MKRARWIIRTSAVLLLSIGTYFFVLMANGNFHAVVPGEVYRSAQPSATELARYHANFGIRSVINLRGSNPEQSWYRDELAVTKKLGIAMIDVPMSAKRLLPPDKTRELIHQLEVAPKPVLIHCSGGADRTGLASALYLAAIAKAPEAIAEGQLSVLYGHFNISVFSRETAMDQSFEDVENEFGYSGSLLGFVADWFRRS